MKGHPTRAIDIQHLPDSSTRDNVKCFARSHRVWRDGKVERDEIFASFNSLKNKWPIIQMKVFMRRSEHSIFCFEVMYDGERTPHDNIFFQLMSDLSCVAVEREDQNADTTSKPIFNSELQLNTGRQTRTKRYHATLGMSRTGFKYTGRWRWSGNGERDTGGHNEGGANNHTEGNNQDQGRQSQGDRWHKDFKIRHKTETPGHDKTSFNFLGLLGHLILLFFRDKTVGLNCYSVQPI